MYTWSPIAHAALWAVSNTLFRVNVFGSLVLLMAGAGLGLFNQMLSAQAYFLIFLMALSSQVIAWLLVNHALGDLPAAAASIALVGQPIVTTLWAWLLLGEVPTSLQAVGGLVCLAGILIVQLSSTRRIESQATIGGLDNIKRGSYEHINSNHPAVEFSKRWQSVQK